MILHVHRRPQKWHNLTGHAPLIIPMHGHCDSVHDYLDSLSILMTVEISGHAFQFVSKLIILVLAILLQISQSESFQTTNVTSKVTQGHFIFFVLVLFDRQHMIFYYCFTVAMSLSCTIFEIITDIFQNSERRHDQILVWFE